MKVLVAEGSVMDRLELLLYLGRLWIVTSALGNSHNCASTHTAFAMNL